MKRDLCVLWELDAASRARLHPPNRRRRQGQAGLEMIRPGAVVEGND